KHSRAIIIACSALSITHGPAMTVSRPSPNVTLSIENDFTAENAFTLLISYSLSIRHPFLSVLSVALVSRSFAMSTTRRPDGDGKGAPGKGLRSGALVAA